MDQYLADYRSALRCFLRDVTDRSTAQSAPESNGEAASSILSSPAEMLKQLAEVQTAGRSLKDLLSLLLGNNPVPARAETTGDDATSRKPLVTSNDRRD